MRMNRFWVKRIGLCSLLIGGMSLSLSFDVSLDEGELSVQVSDAKPKKQKRYDRRQREAKKLIDSGHPAVTLTLKTEPKVRATVYHGKEVLGATPLTLTWPKDSGPIDITLKASGYLTVNSRLYTHKDDRVTVNMFKVDQSHLLFGYRKKVKSEPEEPLDEE